MSIRPATPSASTRLTATPSSSNARDAAKARAARPSASTDTIAQASARDASKARAARPSASTTSVSAGAAAVDAKPKGKGRPIDAGVSGAASGRANLDTPTKSVPKIVTTPPPATVTKPTGPTARELDRAVPSSKRGEVVDAQAQVEAKADTARAALSGAPSDEAKRATNSVYAAYYAEHPYYVDPKTDTAYAASFDADTGELTLDRTKELLLRGHGVPALPKEPLAPSATADDKYATSDSSQADRPPTRRTEVSTTAPVEPGRGRPNSRANAGTPTQSIAPTAPDTEGEFDHVSFMRDEHIIMTPGTSEATVTARYTHAGRSDEGADDITIVEEQETDATGKVTRYAVRDRRSRSEDGGTVSTTRSTATTDRATTAEWTTKRTGADGATSSSSTKRGFDGSRVTSDTRTMEESAAGVTIGQTTDTAFAKGSPTVSKVHRSATVGDEQKSIDYVIGFDDDGFANDIKVGVNDDAHPLERAMSVLAAPAVKLLGADKPGAREPLDAWIDERLGTLEAGTSRLGFGIIRLGSRGDDGSLLSPAYLASPGVRTIVDARPVFLEGESMAAPQSLQDSLGKLRESLDAAPKVLSKHLVSVDMLSGRNPGDVYWTERYDGEEFHAGATAGGGVMTYYQGRDANISTTRHELAHLAQETNGPSHDEWVEAIRADVKTDVRDEIAAMDEHRRSALAHRISVEADVAVSDYAEKAFAVDDNEHEDFADSVALYLDSRDKGGILQVREDDGSVTTYDFEDLFPARAKILEGYLNLSPTSPVPAPEWEG
jgi:hypothetical protein